MSMPMSCSQWRWFIRASDSSRTDTLPADALALIRQVQQETHLAYTETRYTE